MADTLHYGSVWGAAVGTKARPGGTRLAQGLLPLFLGVTPHDFRGCPQWGW